jgi:hypothetical protein
MRTKKMDIKEAIKILLEEEFIEDWIYDVRDLASSSGDGFKGNMWDHPRVIRFGEICSVLKKFSEA